jgi:multiple sugar transport system ATP-binding protein
VVLPRHDRDVAVGDTIELGIRPQYLEPHHGEVKGSMHGRVSLSERLGTETVLDITLADGNKVIASINEDKVFEIDEEISLCFDIEKVHVF